MTPLKTQDSPGQLATRALDALVDAIEKLFTAVRGRVDAVRGDGRLRAIPSDRATTKMLATHPHTTVRLSEEQTAIALAIEHEESVDRPAAPA